MALSLVCLLVLIGLGLTVASALGKAPLWTAVFVFGIALLVQCWR